MYALNGLSHKRLATCHMDLRSVVELAARDFPIIVLCGFRNQADQNAAFERKASKLKWPDSAHNKRPSRAVDLAPAPLDWSDLRRFDAMGQAVLAAAEKLGIEIVWGGNWKGFPDRPHFELALPVRTK